MAGAGFRTWTAGEVVTAANLNTYIQQQVNQVYATTAARSSALGTSVSNGMLSYITATEGLDLYTHGAWVGVNYSSITNSTATAYTASASDAFTTITFSGTAAVTLTIPDIFDIGERVDIFRDGGTVSIAAGTGITTWAGAGTASTGKTFTMGTQYTAASIMKVGTASYRVVGAVA